MVGCKKNRTFCKNKWQIQGDKPMLYQYINIIWLLPLKNERE